MFLRLSHFAVLAMRVHRKRLFRGVGGVGSRSSSMQTELQEKETDFSPSQLLPLRKVSI